MVVIMKRFKCPKCGSSVAEEVVVDCCVSNEVTGIDENGDIEYGYCGEVDGGMVSGYQCKYCGYKIENVYCVEDMIEWLNKNC